jgi:hypothetical protein
VKDKLVFIGKFLLFSTLLFVLWVFIGRYYLIVLASIATPFLHLMGYMVDLVITDQIMFTYLGAEMGLAHAELANYNIIPFIALLLATPLSWRRLFRNLLIGLPVIFLFHLIDLLAHFPLYYNGSVAANFITSVSALTRMLIPFLLWFALCYDFILSSFRKTKRLYQCPFCGKRTKGILMHIDDVHGNRSEGEEKQYQQFLSAHSELKT